MIYLLRHGSTDWNENRNVNGEKDPKCQGRCDISLNERGIEQAKEAKEQLLGKKFDRIICSPLKRTRETLAIAYTGDAPITYDERIIERDFGEFEGLTRGEFDFNGFWNLNSNQKFLKAESIIDVETRVFNLLDELNKNSKQNVLIVAHGGVGVVLMSYFEGKPKDGNYLNFELGTGEVKEFHFEQDEKNIQER